MPKNIHAILMRAVVVLLVLVCLSTAMVTGRYARYFSSVTVNESARVAKFEVTVQDQETQYASIPIQPGETAHKYFSVENKSEVAVALVFNVTSKYENLPLRFEYPIRSGTVAPGETKNVSLEITWPAERNDVIYAGRVELIEISVRVEQVD